MRRTHPPMSAIHAIGLALILAFTFVPKASAFDKPDLLTRRIGATSINGESIDQALGRLTEYGIPLGIELGDTKVSPRREIDLDLPETSLKDFLDSVVAKDPRYTWKLERGVIHVWLVSERDTLLASLLDTKISHFAIVGDASKYRVYTDIMNLPEIKAQLATAGVEPMIFLGSGSMTKLKKDTVFDESNLTLKELLDKIVLKTEIKQWVITRWGNNSEYITLKSG